MAQDSPSHSQGNSLEGQRFFPTNLEELQKVVEHAFDYRGDVTIELKTGELIEGYVFNRDNQGPLPQIRLFVKEKNEERMVPFRDIVSVCFSGEDTAFGKSWEDWLQKAQKLKNP